MKKIKELTANQSSLELIVRIERVNFFSATNGQAYMAFSFIDSSGRIEARKWSASETDKNFLKQNAFVHLKNAVVNDYRGQLQIKVNDYAILEETQLSDFNCQVQDFYINAPLNIPEEYRKLLKVISDLENECYREITLKLVQKYESEFLSYPAAMYIHHNVLGGLFWHSYNLVQNILAIKKNYDWANIDWELLICGAVLHDIGKVVEIIDVSGRDYSLEGKLLGHISIGNAEVAKMAEELGYVNYQTQLKNKSVTLLEHLILSSHGKYEFGSPIEPLTIEAAILSTFDNLDARIYRINEEISKVNLDSWTQKIISENNAMFLHHFTKNKKN